MRRFNEHEKKAFRPAYSLRANGTKPSEEKRAVRKEKQSHARSRTNGTSTGKNKTHKQENERGDDDLDENLRLVALSLINILTQASTD